MFPSYCFNQDAATAQYHTEEDTSYTLIYVAKVTGDVNLSFKINDKSEIHVPYSNNITLMYCASLLTHKQVIRKGDSGSSVINFSAYGKKKLEENAFVSLHRRASLTVTRMMSKKVGSFRRCSPESPVQRWENLFCSETKHTDNPEGALWKCC